MNHYILQAINAAGLQMPCNIKPLSVNLCDIVMSVDLRRGDVTHHQVST